MTWEWWIVIAVLVVGLVIFVVTQRARRLDVLNRTVAKSRRALEMALTARAQYAHDFATVGALDMAGAILLTDSADSCLREGMQPISTTDWTLSVTCILRGPGPRRLIGDN